MRIDDRKQEEYKKYSRSRSTNQRDFDCTEEGEIPYDLSESAGPAKTKNKRRFQKRGPYKKTIHKNIKKTCSRKKQGNYSIYSDDESPTDSEISIVNQSLSLESSPDRKD